MVENNPLMFLSFSGDKSTLKYSLRSPWPILSLMGSDDLKQAWGGDDTVSNKILMKNARTLSSIGTKELERRLESYRNIYKESK